jgi:hypothetical protein
MSLSCELRAWTNVAKELWQDERQKHRGNPYWYWFIFGVAAVFGVSQVILLWLQ